MFGSNVILYNDWRHPGRNSMNVIYQDILNLLLIPRTSLSKKRNDDFKRCLIVINFKLYIYI
jgi:hypothetical protein